MNVFNFIPSNFFNLLSSASNQKIYADCLQRIYKEYEREISYRIPKNRIRDVLSMYFLETRDELSEEDYEGERTPAAMAGEVIRKFLSPDVGWLDEEIDDGTYEKQIIITEPGIALAEFLNNLEKPERDEFSSYVFNIYNTLNNKEQWIENGYVNGLKSIYKNARELSKSLKKLSTFIRKIIEKMVQEETLESLSENLIEYCDGNFIREYSRLTKQHNIHIYRGHIKARLDEFMLDNDFIDKMVEQCREEEFVNRDVAENMVLDMIQLTKKFLVEDYDQIMRDIKHKINLYFTIAYGRIRFIQNRQHDIKGNVETVIKYIMDDMDEIGLREEMPDEISRLFLIDRHQFIDEGSVRYPGKERVIKKAVETELEELTEEAIEAARKAQEREAYNPYSRNLMKKYIEANMNGRNEITSDELPMETRESLLANLSAVAYSKDNGYSIEILDGYFETENMLLKRFRLKKEEK